MTDQEKITVLREALVGLVGADDVEVLKKMQHDIEATKELRENADGPVALKAIAVLLEIRPEPKG